MATICNRIRYLRESINISQQKFSELINVSRGYINDIERGKEPSFNFIKTLLKSTNVNLEWLVTGEGEMYRQAVEKRPPTIAEIDKNLEGLTDEQRQEILSRTGCY